VVDAAVGRVVLPRRRDVAGVRPANIRPG